MNKIRIIPFNYYDSFFNMALDEYLLEKVQKEENLTYVRFYSFINNSVSFGKNQKIDEIIDKEEFLKNKIEKVKRITGGRAVFHNRDFTVSFVDNKNGPFYDEAVLATYKKISNYFVLVFKRLNIDVKLAKKNYQKNLRSSLCFMAPSFYEIVAFNKKLTGCAQVRKKNSFMQHCSISMKKEEKLFTSLFIDKSEKDSIKEFSNNTISINEISNITHQDIEREFKNVLLENFDCFIEDLTQNEKEEVIKLSKKYII